MDVTLLPGVNIGAGSVIGAKRLVNKGVIAVGNPCHVLRRSDEQDKIDMDHVKRDRF